MLAGCGRPDTAISVLRHHHDLWEGHSDHAVNHAAQWLTLTEQAHPARCQHHPDPPSSAPHRHAFWQQQIIDARHPHPEDRPE
jgi:hypothetical protein